ncbi:MAG: hypothetical protein Q7T82_20895 [Armatimonadota bacterium]|nr:hypothetical protein [Armatimonadota bacterium]
MRTCRLAIAVIVAGGIMPGVWAQGLTSASATEPSQLRSTAVAPQSAERAKSIRRAIVIINGGDPLRSRAMEDAMAIELSSLGIQTVSRAKVDKIVDDLGRRDSATADKTKAAQPSVSILDVAKVARAEAVISGNMLEERLRSGAWTPSKQLSLTDVLDQPIVVVTASLQIVDAETDEILLVVMGDYRGGKTIPDAASDLVKPIAAARK